MEMLRTGHEELLTVIAMYFTDILTGRMEPPSEWKVARLSIIFKKGLRNDLKKLQAHLHHPRNGETLQHCYRWSHLQQGRTTIS